MILVFSVIDSVFCEHRLTQIKLLNIVTSMVWNFEKNLFWGALFSKYFQHLNAQLHLSKMFQVFEIQHRFYKTLASFQSSAKCVVKWGDMKTREWIGLLCCALNRIDCFFNIRHEAKITKKLLKTWAAESVYKTWYNILLYLYLFICQRT
jgi:hypothetical protein